MTTLIMENVNPEQHKNTIHEEKNETNTQEKETFPCSYPECKAKFVRPSQLKTHMCIHTGEKSLGCDSENCNQELTNAQNSQKQENIHKKDEENHECKLCGISFTKSYNLMKHDKQQHNKDNTQRVHENASICEVLPEEHVEKNKKYRCTFPGCKAKFVKPSQLKTHLCMHTGERSLVFDSENCYEKLTNAQNSQKPEKILRCKLCGITFTKSYNLTKHYKYQHNKNNTQKVLESASICEIFLEEHVEKNKKYRCTYPGCKLKFARPSKLERHMCVHTGERQFICDYDDCDKAYTNACHLKRHKMTHTGAKEVFSCTMCKMTFTESHNLKRHHKRLHDNPLGGIYKHPKICDICLAEFPTRTLLTTHVTEVHERKLYKCEHCPRSFSEPFLLQKHLDSSVHSKNKHCKICSISFYKNQDLRQHNRQEHQEFHSNFTCDLCEKKFSSKRNIRFHLRDHSRDNFIACAFEGCHRIYIFQRNLDQHIRTFHMNEKFECPSCSAKLSTNQKLKEHIQRIHENPQPRKPPKTKGNRKKRRDIGKPKTSAVSQLVGLLLPNEVEKAIMNRHITESEPL